jgi:hypothetical protein
MEVSLQNSDEIYFPKRELGQKVICWLHYWTRALPNAQTRTGFRTGHLSTKDKEHSGRPTQVTIPENVDATHSGILYKRGISAKTIAERRVICALSAAQKRDGVLASQTTLR